MSRSNMNTNKPVIISIFALIGISIIALIASITFYNYSELKTVETNISAALEKGIDPLAVRCAYTHSQDNICLVYASNLNSSAK